MSLHQLATHMAARGRGPDDHLVHMSGNEVAGLQALAKAHGGSLTINPDTGLAEAGFLDSILPMAVGAAAMYFTGGAAGAAAPGLFGMGMPATIGAGVGALQTARTGDLGKGIMAGLGAYGGAGLAGGLMGAGAQQMAGETIAKDALAESALQGTTLPSNYAQLAAQTATPAQIQAAQSGIANSELMSQGFGALNQPGGFSNLSSAMSASGGPSLAKAGFAAAAPVVMDMMQPKGAMPQGTQQMIRPYTFAANPQTQGNMVGNKPMIGASYQPGQDTSERMYFQPQYTALTPYKAAEGGLMSLARMATGEDVMPTEDEEKMAGGGPVEQMSNANAIGANTGYPQADINKAVYAAPYQTPMSQNVVQGTADTGVNSMTGEMNRFAAGGLSSLGGYSDGGRLLKGPGDGMSDNIPAKIGAKQPARLADGEFVVPADVVSHLGNGSTDAGAKQLYKMMDRIRSARTGRRAQGKQINPNKFVPA